MSTSSSSIMTVREMIDMAFGEPDKNIVDHKMIETILYLLARQLRILERRVEIELFPDTELHNSSLSVSEIKLHANVPIKRKRFLKKVVAGGQGTASSVTKKTASDVPGTGSKPCGSKTEDKKLLNIPITNNAGMISDDISSLRRTSVETLSKDDKRSRGKSLELTSNKSSTTDKTLDKTLTDVTPTETFLGSISSDKTSTDKTYSKSSASKTHAKSSVYENEKTSRNKSYSQMTSTKKSSIKAQDKSTTEKSLLDKTTTEKSSVKSIITKTVTSSSAKPPSQDFRKLLEEIEERREMELRVIHQRADSYEVREMTPTPIASMESVEVQYEKLLIVERVPSQENETQTRGLQGDTRHRTPRISVVTQDDFMKLARAVRDLQTRFAVTANPDFPENIKLMQELRKGASLTDAMAALQLSARLEAAEKALGRMVALVTDLAKVTPGMDTNRIAEKNQDTKGTLDDPGTKAQLTQVEAPFEENLHNDLSEILPSSPSPDTEKVDRNDFNNFITTGELNSALEEIHDDLVKKVTEITNRNKANAEHALKIINKLEGKLNASLDLGNRMNNLETLVSEYVEQINILDTGLSSQMTSYQEQLMQMQHDLEGGLEAMAEALSSAGGDTTAVTELNKHFTNLQSDFETTQMRQKDLRDIQTSLSLDLQGLWQQIEILRDTKSDRAEVADALNDKVGLDALNGIVSLQQFNAVRGDLEKKIGAAYEKFNSQETIWQKVIDDLFRELSNKADLIQVVALRDGIHDNIVKLRCKIQEMMNIVGEPKAAAVSRRLHRESTCLSCSSPAHMALEESTVPVLPAIPAERPPTLGAENTSKSKGDGDHGICYAGSPIQHSIDPRAHICHRYCGGSHTRLNNNVISRVPPGMIINPIVKEFTTEVGTDEKAYRIDDSGEMKPCVPCNKPKIESPAEIPEEDKVSSGHDTQSDMTPPDFRHISISVGPPQTHEETPLSLLPSEKT